MKLFKTKVFLIAVAALFTFFLSNDFGLIDIEKTAIITALAVDIEDGEYSVNAQIALPSTSDNNNHNLKAQISGKGYTIGAAIKNLGDLSGWYPKMDFCNLIILGKEVAESGAIDVLDYFSKTLRIQDSAALVQSEKSAKDILEVSTPLDEISAFALQKVVLKNVGFNRDVADSNVKNFVEGYFSDSSSSIMPLVKIVKQDGKGQSGESSSGSSSGQIGGESKEPSLFNPASTSLFYKGVKVGELTEKQTLTFNMLTDNFSLTTLEIGNNDVESEKVNYLLTVKKCDADISLSVEEKLKVNFDVRLYCKISDQNTANNDNQYNKNEPLPKEVVADAENKIRSDIESLITAEKESGCDFLKIKEKLYRHHYDEYSLYKDDFMNFDYTIKVKVEGQK